MIEIIETEETFDIELTDEHETIDIEDLRTLALQAMHSGGMTTLYCKTLLLLINRHDAISVKMEEYESRIKTLEEEKEKQK